MERLKTLAIVALLVALAGSIALAASGGDAEVRITARQLDDGRVEFALQQRTDGEWGERILPRSRYFPTNATVGRWLNSTPMTVSVAAAEESEPAAAGESEPAATEESEPAAAEESEPAAAEESEPASTEESDAEADGPGGEPTAGTQPQPEPSISDPAQPSTGIITEQSRGTTDAGVIWAVHFDDFTDERAAIIALAGNILGYPNAYLYLRCTGNGETLDVFFTNLPVSDINEGYNSLLRWGTTTAEERRLADNTITGNGHFVTAPKHWRYLITQHDTLRIRFTGFRQTIITNYDLRAIRSAPTWANIEACD